MRRALCFSFLKTTKCCIIFLIKVYTGSCIFFWAYDDILTHTPIEISLSPNPKPFPFLRYFSLSLSLGAVGKKGLMKDVVRARRLGRKDAISDSSSARAALTSRPVVFFLFFLFLSFKINFTFVLRKKILFYFLLIKKIIYRSRERTKTPPPLHFFLKYSYFLHKPFSSTIFFSISLGIWKIVRGTPTCVLPNPFFSLRFSLSLSRAQEKKMGKKWEKNEDAVCPDLGGYYFGFFFGHSASHPPSGGPFFISFS